MKLIKYDLLEENLFVKDLANGLTVFLLPKVEMTKSYAVLMTNYGSMHRQFTPLDQAETITVPDGIAHFLEHKLFEKEDRDLSTEFMALGASPNAYTSFTKTAYLFSTIDHLEEAVSLLLDFVQEPYFSETSVEKEKGIIAQEIKMYDDDPDWRSFMGILQNMYTSLPIYVDIAGTVESIEQITKADLYTCYESFYHPSNMALFVTGRFDAASLMALIEENQEAKSFVQAPPVQVSLEKEAKAVAKEKESIRLAISKPKVSLGIKESEQNLFGEALLKRELLQQMTLDYLFSKSGPYYQVLDQEALIDDSFDYSSSVDAHYNFSIISSHTEHPDKLAQRLKELLLGTRNLRIDGAVFQAMKVKKMGELLSEMNSLEQIANQYLHYHFVGIDYFQILSYMEQLKISDFQGFLQSWIEESRLSTFTIMPKEAK